MLDGCSTHTVIQEKILPWLNTKFVASSSLIVENLHGEEEYPVSRMEVELPQVDGKTAKMMMTLKVLLSLEMLFLLI